MKKEESGKTLAVIVILVVLCLTSCTMSPRNTTPLYSRSPGALTESPTDTAIAESRTYENFSKSPSRTRRAFASLRPLSRNEELWIITRSSGGPFVSDDYPTGGCLRTRIRTREVPLPLKHTDVQASISAYIATVRVRQEFHNPFSEKIEAVYTFPLPENAAVNEFIMTIGDRHIRGIIREREEAKEIYDEAKRQGYTASLLTQERPNIFTQSVANIEPGREIDINITYFHTLAYVDGWHEFVFPMVVGPRFNPPYSTDGVGAVGRGQRGGSGQPAEVQYLRPHERSGHDIALHVDIDATVKIEEFQCVTHKIRHEAPEAERLSVWLAKENVI